MEKTSRAGFEPTTSCTKTSALVSRRSWVRIPPESPVKFFPQTLGKHLSMQRYIHVDVQDKMKSKERERKNKNTPRSMFGEHILDAGFPRPRNPAATSASLHWTSLGLCPENHWKMLGAEGWPDLLCRDNASSLKDTSRVQEKRGTKNKQSSQEWLWGFFSAHNYFL